MERLHRKHLSDQQKKAPWRDEEGMFGNSLLPEPQLRPKRSSDV